MGGNFDFKNSGKLLGILVTAFTIQSSR